MAEQESGIVKPLGPKARRSIHKMEGSQDSSYNSFSQNSSYNSHTYLRHVDKHEKHNHHHSTDSELPSDETDEELQETYELYKSTSSNISITRERTDRYRASLSPHQPKQSPTSYTSAVKIQTKKQTDKGQGRGFGFNTSIIIVVVSIFLCTITWASSTGPQNKTVIKEINNKRETRDDLIRLMKSVQMKFQNQMSNAWNDILAAIHEVLLYPERPSIIILFGNEADTMKCLAKEIGSVSSIILGTGNYLTLNPKDFGTDLGELIYNLKMEIPKKKAVVIQDLLTINEIALKAFHNLCDRENPLVKEAIYIITIITDGYQSPQQKLAFIEKQIINKLSDKIDKDTLFPLVTRITDGAIIEVQSEPHMNKCTFS